MGRRAQGSIGSLTVNGSFILSVPTNESGFSPSQVYNMSVLCQSMKRKVCWATWQLQNAAVSHAIHPCLSLITQAHGKFTIAWKPKSPYYVLGVRLV